ncbi:ferritin-like domain-containing protein [Hymenobacter sp. BT491]|uniref:ferritin-like domain-containing protein n=1 Tax=Hymenobacter sp. BT491 TaxID=2766779 RepID=UPI001653D154|nr:PA2169 family four-helix-bundle protein [Hymenobacter sp. BT491]MBC6991846.1 PA2169 family four-helix-bundle protein [Hymenobacter sp. BT491]
MATDSKTAATLNELTLFVNDRIEGYKHATTESTDPQHKAYYQELANQSQQFANELNGFARSAGSDGQTGTTTKGKLYRGWMDAKALVTGRDEAAVLESNIYGEEWALKAYQEALADSDLTGPARQAVERQYQISQQTYSKLKAMKSGA